MDKQHLTTQLRAHIRDTMGVAEREMVAAADAARDGEDRKTRREDTRMAQEFGALASGQKRRVDQGRRMLSALESFAPRPFREGRPAALGAIVEIEDDDTGDGRTFFLAPAGAGIGLTGPGGDGFLTVVTPASPIGKAVRGLYVGDAFDVTVDGQTRSWEVTWIA